MLIRSFNSSQIYFIIAKVETFMKTEKFLGQKTQKLFFTKEWAFMEAVK